MGGMSIQAPGSLTPPDFTEAAQRQADSSRRVVNDQTTANRPGQSTAWGNTTWSQGPNGQWGQIQSLSGPLAGLLGQAEQAQQKGIDYSALPQMTDGSAARDQAISGAYDQATSRLDPRFQQAGASLQSQLTNQGLAPGDAAWNNSMQNFGREKNDAYSSAMNGAISQGTVAGQALFNQGLQGRQQALGEATQQMNQPMQGLSGLLGTSGQLNMPGFSQAGQAQPLNALGASGMQYQGVLNEFGAITGLRNAFMTGASDLGAAGVGLGVSAGRASSGGKGAGAAGGGAGAGSLPATTLI